MYTVLEYINAFWASHGEWITVALIPTVVAGLTISPSTAKAGPWVTKAWNAVKLIMGFLSVLTHKDQPGTFKLPLKTAKPKKAEEPVTEDKAEEKVVDVPPEETK